MRRANSAAPAFVPASAPAAKCEWCGQESDDPLQALVSVCKGCGRASSSRTIRAVSSAPTRRYPAFNHPDSLPPPGFDGIDIDVEAGPTFGPTKKGAFPPVLPAAGVPAAAPAKAGPPPVPVNAPKSAPRPVAGRPPPIPVSAILPPLTAPVIKNAKLSLASRSEADTALTIPVPAKGPPRPTPSKAPMGMNPLSIIPLGPNSIIPKAPAVFVDFDMAPKKEDVLATADTKVAPSYRLPAVSISPIISIPPPPVMMPALGSLPRISISPVITVDDAYGPEPEAMAANDVPLVAPPPLPTFVGLPPMTPLHMMSAASAKSTAKSGPAVLAAPLPDVSGPLAAAKAPSLKQQLETMKPTTAKNAAAGTKMLPFILGGIAVGALVAAGIVAKTHAFKPAPSSLLTPTTSTTSPAVTPLASAAVVTRPVEPAVASAGASAPAPTTTAKPAPEPTALAAPPPGAPSVVVEAPKAATTTVMTPEPAAAPPSSGSFIGAGSLEDARAARAAGDFAKAAAIYNRLAANPDTQLDALMGLGDMARTKGDNNAAKSAYIRALTSAPGYLPAALGAADAAWDLGSIEEARARYHRVLEKYPLRMLPPRVKERSTVGDK